MAYGHCSGLRVRDWGVGLVRVYGWVLVLGLRVRVSRVRARASV